MPVFKFTWSQEFGWNDWRDQEWTVRAKNEREAWLHLYDNYGVIDYYIEWLEEESEEEIEINKNELWKTVDLEKLHDSADWMTANERLSAMIGRSTNIIKI